MNLDSKPLRYETDALLADLAQLELDADYRQLLQGKNVIVVGPAQTLLGTNQGKMIESYDLVVRFNTVIEYLPFNNELAKDVGVRTDILYSNNDVLMNGVLGQERISHEQFARIANQPEIKWIISTNNDFSYLAADLVQQRSVEGEEFRRFLGDKQIQSHFKMLFSLPDLVTRWMNGYVGRTGFLSLVDLLRYDVNRLHVIGMTFYHSGGHLFLKDSIPNLHPLGNHRGELPPNPTIKGHNSYLELEIMKSLGRHFRDKLALDVELQALLAT
ncbi:MAG TPA: glycosyltransferase family 29 protein [Blastocatellia bacterium]|nr:glycosyltransferase family 29 protein [Blastocatellia bacterium]